MKKKTYETMIFTLSNEILAKEENEMKNLKKEFEKIKEENLNLIKKIQNFELMTIEIKRLKETLSELTSKQIAKMREKENENFKLKEKVQTLEKENLMWDQKFKDTKQTHKKSFEKMEEKLKSYEDEIAILNLEKQKLYKLQKDEDEKTILLHRFESESTQISEFVNSSESHSELHDIETILHPFDDDSIDESPLINSKKCISDLDSINVSPLTDTRTLQFPLELDSINESLTLLTNENLELEKKKKKKNRNKNKAKESEVTKFGNDVEKTENHIEEKHKVIDQSEQQNYVLKQIENQHKALMFQLSSQYHHTI